MLSNSFLLTIKEKLSQKIFTSDDFKLHTNSTSSGISLNIMYLYNSTYKFTLFIDQTGSNFSVNLSPGTIIANESFSDLSHSQVMFKIDTWLNNISNSLEIDPVVRKVLNNEKAIQEIRDSFNDLFTDSAEEFFSDSEGQDIKQRLDKLEKMFSEKLEEDVSDKELLKQEVSNLKNEINALKVQVGAFSKKNWLLSLSTKFYLWGQRNPTTVRRLGGFTRELLPQEVKELVTDEALDQLLPVPVESEESKK